jgi:hypothetical protein
MQPYNLKLQACIGSCKVEACNLLPGSAALAEGLEIETLLLHEKPIEFV